MIEIVRLDCLRARSLLARYVDGELGAEDCEVLRGHRAQCAECRASLAAFAEMDSVLTGWGRELGSWTPARADARERLASQMGALGARRRAIRFVPAIATAIAAGVVLLTILPHRKPPVEPREQSAFIEIPYLAPLDPHENATVVRINIRVATLIAVGYRVAADPDEIVPADVLVGEDGRAHAVRVPADVGLNGTGD